MLRFAMFPYPDSDGIWAKGDQHFNVSLSLYAKLCRAQCSQRDCCPVWVRLHVSESVRPETRQACSTCLSIARVYSMG